MSIETCQPMRPTSGSPSGKTSSSTRGADNMDCALPCASRSARSSIETSALIDVGAISFAAFADQLAKLKFSRAKCGAIESACRSRSRRVAGKTRARKTFATLLSSSHRRGHELAFSNSLSSKRAAVSRMTPANHVSLARNRRAAIAWWSGQPCLHRVAFPRQIPSHNHVLPVIRYLLRVIYATLAGIQCTRFNRRVSEVGVDHGYFPISALRSHCHRCDIRHQRSIGRRSALEGAAASSRRCDMDRVLLGSQPWL